MLTCRHCGWDNPEEAAFCTNCGRGLSRGRGAERPTDSSARLRALADGAPPAGPGPTSPAPPTGDAASGIAQHEATGPGAPPGPAGANREGASGPDVDGHAPTAPAPEASAPPMPRLSAPAPQVESAPTLLDFRLPSDMIAELARTRARRTDPTPAPVAGGTAAVSPEAGGGPAEGAADAAPPLGPATLRGTEAPTLEPDLAGPESPVTLEPEAFEAVPPDDDDPPGPVLPPKVSSADPASGKPRVASPPPPPLSPAPPGDSMDEVPEVPPDIDPMDSVDLEPVDDLEGGEDGGVDRMAEAIEALTSGEDAPDDIPELSTSDLDVEGAGDSMEGMLDTGDFEAVDLADKEGGRLLPPPLPELTARFLLRPISQHGGHHLVPVGDAAPVFIGRLEGDVRVEEDAFASPLHARFLVDEDALWVEDLDSLNGVWLRVRFQHLLVPGDEILVGQQVLRLDEATARTVGGPPADGTHRLGARASRSPFRLTQLADDGQPLDRYHLAREGCRIGRHIADLVFTEDNFMSGTHALLLPRDDGVELRDLSSRNGSWVRIRARHALVPGDAVMVGRSVWRVGLPVQ